MANCGQKCSKFWQVLSGDQVSKRAADVSPKMHQNLTIQNTTPYHKEYDILPYRIQQSTTSYCSEYNTLLNRIRNLTMQSTTTYCTEYSILLYRIQFLTTKNTASYHTEYNILPYMIFVIFSPRTTFWPYVVSTQKVRKLRQNRFRDKTA